MRTLHVNGPPKRRRNSPFHFALSRRILSGVTLSSNPLLHMPLLHWWDPNLVPPCA